MTFTTQGEAKRFFVDRVVEQARADGVSLTEAERHMLSWSESDPDFEPDDALADALELSDEEFEGKVAGLIRRAFDRECGLDGQAERLYREARTKLSEGDHYILVMVTQALG